MSESTPSRPPRDAATIALLRDAPDGFEVFLVRRHGGSGFMANAHVFPGGKLDDADFDAAIASRCRGRDAHDAAAALGEDGAPEKSRALFVAAIRETFEEAGVLLADVSPEARAQLATIARPLDPAITFSDWLARLDAHLRLDAVVPFARWVTPIIEPRRFDARFFAARLPEGQQGRHDTTETTASEWLRPGDAVVKQQRGEIHLAPPTLRTLENFAAFSTIDALLGDARTRIPPTVRPIAVERDGEYALVLPGDPDHPEPGPVLPGSTRLVLAHGRFWSRDGSPSPAR